MKIRPKLIAISLIFLLLFSNLLASKAKTVYAVSIPDLLITEVMPLSQSTNDSYEYIELYNCSSSSIDLKDYRFITPDIDISVSKIIPSKGTIVICTKNTSLQDFNNFYGCSLTEDKYLCIPNNSDILCNNSSFSIILIKDDSTVIARAKYDKRDVFEKKSITFKYPQSGFDMIKLNSNQSPSPGTVSSDQIPFEGIRVNGITLDKQIVTLDINQTVQLYATIIPDTATNKAVVWSSSNTNVAQVNQNGLVYAKGEGSAIITAKTQDGGYTAFCAVIVKRIPVTGIYLDKTNVTIDVGKSIILTPTITPQNATNKELIWHSTNSSIASVDYNGIITGRKAGTAVVTVETADGHFKAACAVVVNEVNTNIPVTGITINKSNITIEIGKIIAIEAKIKPENATNKNIFYYSSNPDIASIDSNGILTAKSKGTVLITAKTEDGGYSASCIINVVENQNNYIPVTGIKLNKSLLIMKINETEKLTAYIKPSNATNQKIIWSSRDNNIASVDLNGNIKALKEGITLITAKTEDGNYTAQCIVVVEKNIDLTIKSIKLNKSILYIDIGKVQKLNVIIEPNNIKNKTIIYKSNNSKVAAVLQDGTVVGLKKGCAIITATVENKSVRCIVYVGYKRGKGHYK